jgi:hypothetical protein
MRVPRRKRELREKNVNNSFDFDSPSPENERGEDSTIIV